MSRTVRRILIIAAICVSLLWFALELCAADEISVPRVILSLLAAAVAGIGLYADLSGMLSSPSSDGSAADVGVGGDPCPEGASALNPFCDRGRINDPARFFGRQRIVRELREALSNGNHISLVGDRQIGKSSLLYYLYQTRSEWLPDHAVHYVDVQGVGDEAAFRARVLEGLGEAQCADWEVVRGILRTRPLVLLLDEVEKLASPSFSTDLHDLLRAWAQDEGLTLAVASYRPLEEVFPPRTPPSPSPWTNLFIPKEIGPFTPREVRDFLKARLTGTGVRFTREEVDSLLAQSGGHPCRVQELAHDLYERKRGG